MPEKVTIKQTEDREKALGVYIDFRLKLGTTYTQRGGKMEEGQIRLKTILEKYTNGDRKAINNFLFDIQCIQMNCTKEKLTLVIPGNPFDTTDPDLPPGSPDPKHMTDYVPPTLRKTVADRWNGK